MLRRASGAAIVAGFCLSACGGDGATSPAEQHALYFVTQPGRTAIGTVLTPPTQVEVRTLSGELNTSSSVAVTVELQVPPDGALTGKTTVNSVAGVATFDDLRIDRAGDYRLSASSPNAITHSLSASFRVFPPYHRIAAGEGHSCGATVPGATYCWGDNGAGQLGIGNEPLGASWQLPQELPGSAAIGFTALGAGGYHTCALTNAGVAYCWGSNAFYQVGDGTTVNRNSPTLVHTPSGISFSAISVGYWHSCAVTASGAAYCWGSSGVGALGAGSTTAPGVPVAVSAPVGVTFRNVSAGGAHTCGVTPNGAAYCWGENPYGGLGDGTTTERDTPVQVSAGGLSFSTVSAGDEHSCALNSAGVAYCWGRNDGGQLGDGTYVSRDVPVPVTMPSGVTFASIDASSLRTCALTPAPGGAIYCWGNGSGPTPVLVPAPAGVSFATLDVGMRHACAVTPAGLAYCWGGGPIGTQYFLTSTTPVPVSQ